MLNEAEKAIIRVFLESALALNSIRREVPAIDIANELHTLHVKADDLELAGDILNDYKLLDEALKNPEIVHAV